MEIASSIFVLRRSFLFPLFPGSPLGSGKSIGDSAFIRWRIRAQSRAAQKSHSVRRLIASCFLLRPRSFDDSAHSRSLCLTLARRKQGCKRGHSFQAHLHTRVAVPPPGGADAIPAVWGVYPS